MSKYGLGKRLENRVAIVTGAGGAIAGFTAKLLAAHGAKIIATDMDFEAVSKTVEEIKSEGNEAIAIKHDITSENDWDVVVSAAISTFGRLDILANVAGWHIPEPRLDLQTITLDEWNKHIAINLSGAFLGTKRAIPEMLKNNYGSIINIASVAALKGGSFYHYSAAKSGLRALSRNTALAYATNGIRANTIFPGLVESKLTAAPLADPTIRDHLIKSNAIPHFGDPDDIAYGILYLASDESKYVTGAELVIDGGVMTK